MERKVLKFDAELHFEGIKIEGVNCEITLPELQNEKIFLEAYLDGTQENFLSLIAIPGKFSLRSSSSKSQEREIISVDKAYLQTTTCTHQNNLVLKATVLDLKVQRVFDSSHNDISETKKTIRDFHFWLTQSIQLSPGYSTWHSFDGNTVVKDFRNISLEIREGLKLKFIDYYFHYNDPNRKNKRISESTLAAELSDFAEPKSDEELFSEIELLLRIVSFSERRKIACYGYTAYSQGDIHEAIDFYKPGSLIPKENFEHSHDNLLIEGEYFEEFIMQSLKNLRDCAFKEYLLEAIGKAAYHANTHIESDYLTYYSALENLVNGFRDTHNLRFILEEEPCKKFGKDIKNFISKHDSFINGNDEKENQTRKEQRKLMYEKIPELNRVAFGTVFKLFCDFYQVDIEDLWPLLDGKSLVSLSTIRNKIIHGERFEKEKEYEALMYAKINLQWILERCILRVLDWDIERSRVHPLALTIYFAQSKWKEFSAHLL
jgi:hypothetical protein